MCWRLERLESEAAAGPACAVKTEGGGCRKKPTTALENAGGGGGDSSSTPALRVLHEGLLNIRDEHTTKRMNVDEI